MMVYFFTSLNECMGEGAVNSKNLSHSRYNEKTILNDLLLLLNYNIPKYCYIHNIC